jgi:hypothetical protein
MAFGDENIEILKRLETLDVTITKRAEEMAETTLKEFKIIVQSFEDSLRIEYKGWRQKNIELESNIEHLSLWSKVFTQMLDRLKDE